MPRPFKKSNLMGGRRENLKQYIIDMDNDIKTIFDYVLRTPRIYTQATEPTLEDDSWAFWKDSGTSKFYLLLNVASTQKKVELV